MKNINTYGLKMENLKEIAAMTKDLTPYLGITLQISYDRETGKLYGRELVGGNSWVEYDDPAMILVCYTASKMTQQDIADKVDDAVRMARYAEEVRA